MTTTTMDLHHPILREFPDDRETIKRLKASDERFRKMFEEYHQLDDAIYRIEEEIEFASDQEIEEMKKRRAWLKDQIYHTIRHPSIAIAAAALQAQHPQRAVATP
ncbi:MAG TPA: YdcH family protein [Candidatus Binatia bacterium]|nr:YdcH family protein [Candidatus Binatia bacterium]